MRLHAVFMGLFSQHCNCAGCAAIGSVNLTEQWLMPNKMGLIRVWSSCCVSSPIHPWNWFRALQRWVPNVSNAHAMFETTLPLPYHVNEKGKQVLGVGNTWGTRTSQGKYLRDENFMGDCSHFLWLTPHWGSLEDCFAYAGYGKLRRDILGPRSLILYWINMVSTMYSVM